MSTTTSNNNRRVHFHAYDELHEIESCKEEYTKQEITDSWYTASQMRTAAMKRIEAASEWRGDRSSGFCIRGLEQYTPQGKKRTAKVISRYIDAVMDEQEAQWSTGEDDYERFAVVSQAISKFSVGLALLRAERDEIEAKRIYRKQKNKTWKSKQHHSSSKIVVKPIIDLDDDQTSVCSDLSRPGADSSLHSKEDACEMTEGGMELEPNRLGTDSFSSSLAKVKAMKMKIKEISQVLKTLQALKTEEYGENGESI